VVEVVAWEVVLQAMAVARVEARVLPLTVVQLVGTEVASVVAMEGGGMATHLARDSPLGGKHVYPHALKALGCSFLELKSHARL